MALATTSPLAVVIPFAGIVGLFVGSFLNVVVYRTPRSLSVVAPRSFCPTCNRQLEWWENIPVASWLFLRGRCRTCTEPISLRYPIVEAVTGATFALVTWGLHGTGLSVGYCGLAATMISVALIEYGGLRSPLGVAAVGTGGSEVAILVAAAWHQHWRVAVGSLVGLAAAAAIYGILRSRDPDCVDPRGHGRTALLVAGSWLGGLGPGPAAVGVVAGIVIFAICMVIAPVVTGVPERGASSTTARSAPAFLSTPLVTGVAVALVASLVVAR